MKTQFLFLGLLVMVFPSRAEAKTASASLQGIGSATWVNGTVNFKEEKGGLTVTADVKSVNPGKHGFHIHENGSCERNGIAAGNHFNPSEVQHGLLVKDGFQGAHAGDLGNLEVGSDGAGKYEAFIPGLSLSEGAYNVIGRSVILHEKEDDLGQPTGNAGGRIACGVIQ